MDANVSTNPEAVAPPLGSVEPHAGLLNAPLPDQLLFKMMTVENLLRSTLGAIFTLIGWTAIRTSLDTGGASRDRQSVLDWIAAAGVEIVSIDAGIDFMRQTMAEYGDLPCDFADASLVYAASGGK